MFKRLLWLCIGIMMGTGQTLWFMRKLRRRIDRYRPTKLTTDIGETLSVIGQDLRAAVAEGRVAMNERELELRARMSGRRG